jgi:hypothetical protein
MVGTAERSERLHELLWTLVREASQAMSDFQTGLAGLIALGIFIAVLVLIYFVWVAYQLLIVGATWSTRHDGISSWASSPFLGESGITNGWESP